VHNDHPVVRHLEIDASRSRSGADRVDRIAERRSSVGYCLALISLIGCWLHTGYKSQVEAQIMRRTVVDLEDVYKMLEEAQKD
jgi:hypothetical protein